MKNWPRSSSTSRTTVQLLVVEGPEKVQESSRTTGVPRSGVDAHLIPTRGRGRLKARKLNSYSRETAEFAKTGQPTFVLYCSFRVYARTL